jgi:hypothetical protein
MGLVNVYIRVFWGSALVGSEWSASHLGCFTHGEIGRSSHWIGGWVSPIACPDSDPSTLHPTDSHTDCVNPLFLSIYSLKLHGLSPRANYTDRVTAFCQGSDCQLLRIEGATWSE